jgi:hypothetical protein
VSRTIGSYAIDIFIYCMFHNLPTNVKLVVWTLPNINNFLG